MPTGGPPFWRPSNQQNSWRTSRATAAYWPAPPLECRIDLSMATTDETTTFLSRRWSRFLVLLGLFTVLGLIDAGQFYIHVKVFRGNTIHWEEAIAVGLGDWYLWAALSPIIFRFAQQFPIDASHWPRRLLIHFGFGCLVMLFKIALDLPIYLAVLGK